MDKLFLILNPIAGSGHSCAVFAAAEKYLQEKDIPFTSVRTEREGHATVLAAAAVSDGYRRIVTFGGDGTLREVASALKGTEAELAFVPCGSGNDLARALHIPTEPIAAMELAVCGQARPMDTATANGDPFFNAAGFGFDVDVLDEMERYRAKGIEGSKAYRKGLFTALKKLTHRQTHVIWKDENGASHDMDANLLILAACNGTHFGGGMNVAPKADPFDGYLDICAIHDINRLNMWYALPRFLKGKHLGLKQVEYFRATELIAVSTPASRMQIDGEVKEGTPVVFRLEKEKLLVVCP